MVGVAMGKRRKRPLAEAQDRQELLRWTLGWPVAAERMNQVREGRLGWLLRFLALDLDALSEGAWLDLRFDVLVFPHGAPFFHGSARAPDREEVRRFQMEVREGLKILFEEGFWDLEETAIGIQLQRIKEEPLALGSLRPPDRARIEKAYKTTWQAACLTTIADLLATQGERIRQCINCGKLFLAVKRQEYCTLRCSQTTRTRRYREAHREDAYGRRHRAYQQSIERKLGARVRAEKRGPRKKS